MLGQWHGTAPFAPRAGSGSAVILIHAAGYMGPKWLLWAREEEHMRTLPSPHQRISSAKTSSASASCLLVDL